MSIIKLKAKISEKKQKEKLSDEKLSDTVGGLALFASHCPVDAPSLCFTGSDGVQTPTGYNSAIAKGHANIRASAVKGSKTRDPKLGKLIGYCTDCKCPVYSVTRKNHAGHNVITGSGR